MTSSGWFGEPKTADTLKADTFYIVDRHESRTTCIVLNSNKSKGDVENYIRAFLCDGESGYPLINEVKYSQDTFVLADSKQRQHFHYASTNTNLIQHTFGLVTNCALTLKPGKPNSIHYFVCRDLHGMVLCANCPFFVFERAPASGSSPLIENIGRNEKQPLSIPVCLTNIDIAEADPGTFSQSETLFMTNNRNQSNSCWVYQLLALCRTVYAQQICSMFDHFISHPEHFQTVVEHSPRTDAESRRLKGLGRLFKHIYLYMKQTRVFVEILHVDLKFIQELIISSPEMNLITTGGEWQTFMQCDASEAALKLFALFCEFHGLLNNGPLSDFMSGQEVDPTRHIIFPVKVDGKCICCNQTCSDYQCTVGGGISVNAYAQDMSTVDKTNMALNSIHSLNGQMSCPACSGALNIRKLSVGRMPIGTKLMIKFTRHSSQRTLDLAGEGSTHALRWGENMIVPVYFLFNKMCAEMGQAGHYLGVQITPGGHCVLVDDHCGPIFMNELPLKDVDMAIYEVKSHNPDPVFMQKIFDQHKQEYVEEIFRNISDNLDSLLGSGGLVDKAKQDASLCEVMPDAANAAKNQENIANARNSISAADTRCREVMDRIKQLLEDHGEEEEEIVDRTTTIQVILSEVFTELNTLIEVLQ